jgi:hypothetical protein
MRIKLDVQAAHADRNARCLPKNTFAVEKARGNPAAHWSIGT